MSHLSLSRLLAVSLLVATMAAPSAIARPDAPSHAATPAPKDLRSPDTKDRADSVVGPHHGDAAAPDQQDRRDGRLGAPTSSPVGAPVDGGGSPVPASLLIIAGAGVLLLAGGMLTRPRMRAARARL
jgi:hypothetical protein